MRQIRHLVAHDGQGAVETTYGYPHLWVDRRGGGLHSDPAIVGKAVWLGGADTMRVFGEAVTGSYFQLLGVRPRLGRTLLSPPASSARIRSSTRA